MEEDMVSFDAIITDEMNEDRKIYNATCEELGITDFGDTPEEAIDNLKKGMKLLFEVEPSKKELLMKEKPIMVKRIFL